MRQFLLGVITTLVVSAIATGALLVSLGSGAEPATPQVSGSSVTPEARVEAPGDLTEEETWLGAVDLAGEDVVSSDGELTLVDASGSGVRFGPDGLRAARLDIDARIPFDSVAEQVGPDTRIYAVSGGLAGIEREVTVLGRDLTVRATGAVTADGGQLVIEPETVDLGGPSFVDATLSAIARTLVTIRQDVPGAPSGMALTDVSVTGAGFDARLTGTDVTIGPR